MILVILRPQYEITVALDITTTAPTLGVYLSFLFLPQIETMESVMKFTWIQYAA